MAETSVRGSRTLKITKKGDTLSALLVSNKPLVQYFQNGAVQGSWQDATNYRTVTARVMSTLSNVPLATGDASSPVKDVVWRFNGSTVSSSDTRFVIGKDVNNQPTLQIKDDIMANLQGATTIEFSANVFMAGYTTAITAVIDVKREETSDGAYNAYILDVAGNGGIIKTNADGTTSTVTLRSILEKGGIEVTTGITYQWWRMTLNDTDDNPNDKRTRIAGATSKDLVITAAMVSATDTFQCEMIFNSGNKLSPMFSVQDQTDSLDIAYNYKVMQGATEVNSSESNIDVGQSIVYTPAVVNFGSRTPAAGTWTYRYQKVKADGTLVGASATGATYKVDYADILNAGGQLDVLFEATGG
ncbi:hypothetical protein [Sphingobacterium thalpophilum]|uniref:hypothetical protein n=1 Tax=Sphingobacterium thalpophilum TaxID=259 RepID=UPI0024A76287|nr:hypothetical protein [Sphingobacterium thalpophilum]